MGVSVSPRMKTARIIEMNVVVPTMGLVSVTPRRLIPVSLNLAAIPGAATPARMK